MLATFKDMLQMSTMLTETLLNAPCKIVHHADTLCPWNLPDPCCYCSFQVHDCLGVVFIGVVFQITPQIEIWGVKVR